MRFCKTSHFDNHILGIRLGWSAAGPPLMTVYCYIFHEIMIDTGLSLMEKEVLNIARSNGVKQIFLTHHHEDHSGNAAAIRHALRADVYGHAFTAKKLETPYPILPYQKYVWGKTTPLPVNAFPNNGHVRPPDTTKHECLGSRNHKDVHIKIDTPLGKILPIHTPGHAKDHTVFFLPEQGILFSGDLYLGDRIRYFRSDEDIGTEIESLKTVAELDFDHLLCAHNPKHKNGKEHILAKLEFLENFYGNVIGLRQKGLSEKQIFNRLKLKEAHFIKWFCFGNVCMFNGVKSIIKHYERHA